MNSSRRSKCSLRALVRHEPHTDNSHSDSFVGGYTAEWLRSKQTGNWDIKAAVENGCKASARVIEHVGCLEPICWADELGTSLQLPKESEKGSEDIPEKQPKAGFGTRRNSMTDFQFASSYTVCSQCSNDLQPRPSPAPRFRKIRGPSIYPPIILRKKMHVHTSDNSRLSQRYAADPDHCGSCTVSHL